jgi:hypothetical protein
MSGQRIQSYREFWPFYVSQHCNPVCRNLHFIGTSLVIAAVILGVFKSPWFFVAAPFCGYFFAWIGHFVFEKNRPATFQYPIWSLIADFHMYGYIVTGKMGSQVGSYCAPRR